MTKSAHPPNAFATSPGTTHPPSAHILPPIPCAASPHSITAESCGYPTPVCSLVVHTDPGQIPTFTISAPFKISSSVIS